MLHMTIETFGGMSQYFLLLTYDFSGVSWVYLLKYKYKVFTNLKKFKVLIEKQCEYWGNKRKFFLN